MKTLQFISLGVFALLAGLTVFFQLRVGMDAGRGRDQTHNRSRATVCAALAILVLTVCIVLGALQK